MAKKKQSMQQAQDATALILNCEADSTQLLVKLCRNSKSWLSPMGWSDKEKGTLLDCTTHKGKTEVQIPEEFCTDLKDGDKLKLSCDDLNFAEEIIWKTSFVPQTSQAVAPAPSVDTEKKRGFFSRFSKDDVAEAAAAPIAPVKSTLAQESSRRAEEAERAAADYRAKMEAAEAARADAKRRAEEAAKAAEEASKAEAERVAEMDRAEKEFKKAESLRLEEQARLDEEIRAEEARRAEDARIAEAKRKKEEAARIAAEQQAERERLQSKIEAQKKEKKALASKLKSLKHDRNELENSVKEDEAEISKISAKASTAEGLTDSDRKAFETENKSLLSLDDQISNLNLAADETEKSRLKLAKRLSQTEAAFNKAQAEAEAAKQRAEEKKASFDAVSKEDAEFKTRLDEIAGKKAGIEKSRDLLRAKVNKLKDQLDASKKQFASETDTLDRMTRAQETRKSELAEMQTKIDGLGTSLNAMDGDITELTLKYANVGEAADTASADKVTITETAKETPAKASEDDSKGFLGRRKKNEHNPTVVPLKSASAKLTEKTPAKESAASAVSTAAAQENGSSWRNRSKSSTMLGLGIGGIVAIGAVYALSQMQPATPKVAAPQMADTTPQETETPVLMASADAAMPEIAVPDAISAETAAVVPVNENTGENAGVDNAETSSEIVAPSDDTVVETVPAVTPVETAAEAETQTAEVTEAEPAPVNTDITVPDMSEPAAEKPVLLASLTEPRMTGSSFPIMFDPFAYAANAPRNAQEAALKFTVPESIIRPEIDPNQTTQAPEDESEITAEETESDAEAETAETTASESVEEAPKAEAAPAQSLRTATRTPAKPEAEVRAEPAVDPAIIRQVQNDLGILGLYSGALTAQADDATLAAMQTFKRNNGLAVDEAFSPSFIRQLGQARTDEITAQQAALAPTPEPEAVQVADLSAQPVAVNTGTPAAPTPEAEEPTAEKVAELTPTPAKIETPESKDRIIEAQLKRRVNPVYPDIAIDNGILVNVVVEVSYDIDEKGKVKNAVLKSTDYDQRYASRFTRSAIAAVKKQRFEPKTVNGRPVYSAGSVKRIVFRGE